MCASRHAHSVTPGRRQREAPSNGQATRLPIERLSRLHRYDDLHKRMMVESCVFRAVAELLGKDPWDLAPGRFRRL